jgi:hypothetical protein
MTAQRMMYGDIPCRTRHPYRSLSNSGWRPNETRTISLGCRPGGSVIFRSVAPAPSLDTLDTSSAATPSCRLDVLFVRAEQPVFLPVRCQTG